MQMSNARYDGLADWYDEVMQDLKQRKPLADVASRMLAELMRLDNTLTIDIGFGTGLFATPVRALGYKPIGNRFVIRSASCGD
jgi:predicted TPR repeat methyltransferase